MLKLFKRTTSKEHHAIETPPEASPASPPSPGGSDISTHSFWFKNWSRDHISSSADSWGNFSISSGSNNSHGSFSGLHADHYFIPPAHGSYSSHSQPNSPTVHMQSNNAPNAPHTKNSFEHRKLVSQREMEKQKAVGAPPQHKQRLTVNTTSPVSRAQKKRASSYAHTTTHTTHSNNSHSTMAHPHYQARSSSLSSPEIMPYNNTHLSATYDQFEDDGDDSDADSIQPSPQIAQTGFQKSTTSTVSSNSGNSSYTMPTEHTSPEPPLQKAGSSPPAEQILGKASSKKESLKKFFKGPYETLSTEQNEGTLKYNKTGEDHEFTEGLTQGLEDSGYDYQYNYGDPYGESEDPYMKHSASSFSFGDEDLQNQPQSRHQQGDSIRPKSMATVVPSTEDISRGMAVSGKYQQRLEDDAAQKQQEYEDTFKVAPQQQSPLSPFDPGSQRRTMSGMRPTAQQDQTGSAWVPQEDPSHLLSPQQMMSPQRGDAVSTPPSKFQQPPRNAYQLNQNGVSDLEAYNQKLAQELDFDKYCKKDAAPSPQRSAAETPSGRVVTKAQYENYRRASMDFDATTAAAIAAANGGNNSDDEADDFEEDEKLENAKMRAKQQAHLAVYRQKMMKVTGAASSFKTPPLNSNGFASPNLSNGSDDEDDLDDVPLGILQAHGFPRDSQRLKTMSSDTNLASHLELSASPMQYSKSASTSPMFKRDSDNLSIHSAGSKMPFGRSRLSGVPHPLLSGPQPNRGLVAEIAREEKEKIRRKSGMPALRGAPLGGNLGGYAGSINENPSLYEAPAPGGLQAQMAQLMQMQMQMQMTLQQQMNQGAGSQVGMQPGMPGVPPGLQPPRAQSQVGGLKHRWSALDLSRSVPELARPSARFGGDNASIASGGSGMSNRSRYRPGFNVRAAAPAFNRSSTVPDLTTSRRVMSQTQMPAYTEDSDDDDDDGGWATMAEQRKALRDQWNQRSEQAV